MLTVLGWTRAQWEQAFREARLPFDGGLLRRAVTGDEDAVRALHQASAKWDERHSFDPGCSPLVVHASYRARSAC